VYELRFTACRLQRPVYSEWASTLKETNATVNSTRETEVNRMQIVNITCK